MRLRDVIGHAWPHVSLYSISYNCFTGTNTNMNSVKPCPHCRGDSRSFLRQSHFSAVAVFGDKLSPKSWNALTFITHFAWYLTPKNNAGTWPWPRPIFENFWATLYIIPQPPPQTPPPPLLLLLAWAVAGHTFNDVDVIASHIFQPVTVETPSLQLFRTRLRE